MKLFSRKPDPADRIRAFWRWWTADGAAAVAAALAIGEPARVGDQLGSRVTALDAGLAWELAPGQVSAHTLVVSCEGNPALRALARRWLLAAPAADETWSYTDQRPPADDPEQIRLSGNGPEIDFAGIRVAARRSGERLDLVVHHPAFAELPEEARLQVTFLALDSALGEAEVELWVGEIATATHPPLDGFGLLALRAAVRDLRQTYVDPDGQHSWVLLSGEGPQGTVLASAQMPLHPITAPLLTTHVAMTVPYTDLTPEGLPGPDSLEALRALEDRLIDVLGADGRVIAHESSAGIRVLHAYADATTDAVTRVRRTPWDWSEGELGLRVRDDPGWEAVRHLRG